MFYKLCPGGTEGLTVESGAKKNIKKQMMSTDCKKLLTNPYYHHEETAIYIS